MRVLGKALIVLLAIGCGGGGGDNGGGSDIAARQCPVPGISLYCPNINVCCADGAPYACYVSSLDRVACLEEPCTLGLDFLDYCDS